MKWREELAVFMYGFIVACNVYCVLCTVIVHNEHNNTEVNIVD